MRTGKRADKTSTRLRQILDWKDLRAASCLSKDLSACPRRLKMSVSRLILSLLLFFCVCLAGSVIVLWLNYRIHSKFFYLFWRINDTSRGYVLTSEFDTDVLWLWSFQLTRAGQQQVLVLQETLLIKVKQSNSSHERASARLLRVLISRCRGVITESGTPELFNYGLLRADESV